MLDEDEFDALIVNHLYEDVVKPAVGVADRIMSGAAPSVRDISQNTGAGLSGKSNDNRAIVVLYSDSKRPDVLETAGKRRIGRPKGAKSGQRSPTQPYRGGVDLSNVTNSKTGWFDRAVQRAEAIFR